MSPINSNSFVDGILLLNKGIGISSNSALQKAKRLYGAKKAGHTGSLDPLATGMLPVCFGEATKMCQYLLDEDKCYQTTGLLGIKTSTADSTGDVITSVKEYHVTEEQLKSALSRYKGQTKQIPSMFSALKHKGVPLYRYARQGVVIERQARDISINQLDLECFDGKKFSLTVSCSKGTYIRNLVEDIGDDLGVGAHVVSLHRVYTLGFEQMPMYTLEELNDMSLSQKMNCLIPMDKAVDYLPKMHLTEEEITTIRQGRKVAKKRDDIIGDIVRLYDEQSKFIGLGEWQIHGELKAKRLLAFRSEPKISEITG